MNDKELQKIEELEEGVPRADPNKATGPFLKDKEEQKNSVPPPIKVKTLSEQPTKSQTTEEKERGG